MTRAVFVIPGDLDTPTGGYVYARKILPLLQKELDITVCALPTSFPFPSADDLQITARAFRDHDGAGTVFLCDGLGYGAIPPKLLHDLKAPLVALVHHPLGVEQGLSDDQAQSLLRSEKASLALARHIVVPSRAIARIVSELFDIASNGITVAEPGVLRGVRAKGGNEPPHIVSVGAITPRKGFDVFVKALAAVRDFDWRATIAGAFDRSPETVNAVRALIMELGLTERVTLTGTLDESAVSALYSSGDIFALASHYEGYGMAFAEAQAHGLLVIASGEGAVADTVPEACGIVCPVGDVDAFADAFRAFLTDPNLRQEKAQAAWTYGQTLPTWEKTAHIIARVLREAGR